MTEKIIRFYVTASSRTWPIRFVSSYNHNSILLVIILIFLLLYSPLSRAIEWQFDPLLTVSETYTDNVGLRSGLGARGGKQDDFITQINPGLSLTATGRRLDLRINYTMNNLIFAKNSNFNRIRQQLNANATVELIRGFFFIDGNISKSQQNATAFGPQAVDNTNVTGNRLNLTTYNISPYARYSFKRFASTELRYTRGVVGSSGRDGLRNSKRDSYQLSLNSGQYFRTLQWGFSYSNNVINFARTNGKIKLERLIANIRYNLTPRLTLTSTGSFEKNNRIRGGSSTPSWTVGFAWSPSQRTEFNFSAGRRFFGDTYQGGFTHRTRVTTWNTTYLEEVTSFNQQAGQFGGFGSFGRGGDAGTLGFGNLNALNSANNGLFLQRRFQSSMTLNGSRNTFTVAIFRLSRKVLSSLDDNVDIFSTANVGLSSNTKQTGGNATWQYRLGARTRTSVSASFVHSEFSGVGTNRSLNNIIYTANATKEFLPDLSGSIRLRRTQRVSNQLSDINGNSVTIFLRKNF